MAHIQNSALGCAKISSDTWSGEKCGRLACLRKCLEFRMSSPSLTCTNTKVMLEGNPKSAKKVKSLNGPFAGSGCTGKR